MPSRREDGSTLPLEIIQLCIRAVLPPLTFSTVRGRSAALIPLSLVNKTWGSLAQNELYRDVGLQNPEQVGRFLESTKDSQRLGHKTHSLHLGDPSNEVHGFQRVMSMLQVLVRTRKVRVIWITGLRPISLFGLAMAPELTELHAYGIRFMEPTPLPAHPYPDSFMPAVLLRNLQSITLHSSVIGLVDVNSETVQVSPHPLSSVLALLFPPLVSISIFEAHSVDPDLSFSAIDLSSCAADSCETLTIDNRHPPPEGVESFVKDFSLEWATILPRYSALQRLALAEAQDLVPLVEALHPDVTLIALRVIALRMPCDEGSHSDLQVLALLKKPPPALRRLQRLVLPVAQPTPCRCSAETTTDGMQVDDEDQEGQAVVRSDESATGLRQQGYAPETTRNLIRDLCAERGINLVENEWEVDVDARQHSEDWETAECRW
ncbi:hypothetical protein P7C70_g5758, partial [Phenoliferia sp. Uapishka_3]